MNNVVVTRHPGTMEFLRRALSEEHGVEFKFNRDGNLNADNYLTIPVTASATVDAVRGKIVWGNLPLHLACHAAAVVAIEFAGQPPRGAEYSYEDMVAAGAKLVRYGVLELPAGETRDSHLDAIVQGG